MGSVERFYTMALYTDACTESQFTDVCGLKGNPLARILFLKKCFINVYIACDKECAMATRVPNPISLYCT